MYCVYFPFSSCIVDIIFLPESNGTSPIRGLFSSIFDFNNPNFFAYSTKAFSVGSPCACSSFSPILESLHKHIAFANSSSFSVYLSTTVILFCVSVPVLSEHITCVHPKASTAVSFLIRALRFAIDVTPIDNIIVTTAGRPSGIAATANAIATKNVSNITFPVNTPCLTIPNINTNILIANTIFVNTFDSSAIFLCSGVCSSSA